MLRKSNSINRIVLPKIMQRRIQNWNTHVTYAPDDDKYLIHGYENGADNCSILFRANNYDELITAMNTYITTFGDIAEVRRLHKQPIRTHKLIDIEIFHFYCANSRMTIGYTKKRDFKIQLMVYDCLFACDNLVDFRNTSELYIQKLRAHNPTRVGKTNEKPEQRIERAELYARNVGVKLQFPLNVIAVWSKQVNKFKIFQVMPKGVHRYIMTGCETQAETTERALKCVELKLDIEKIRETYKLKGRPKLSKPDIRAAVTTK